jgi:uncharacterized protein (DUF362 family)
MTWERSNGKSVVSIAQDADPDRGVTRALDLLGGVGQFAKSARTVLIKPNVGYYSLGVETGLKKLPEGFDPEGYFLPSTDRRVVAALVRLFKAAGVGRVVVADAPVHETDGAWVFERTGLTEAVTSAGGELLDLALEPKVEVEVPGGMVLKTVKVPKIVLDADLFVNAPKLKTTRVGLLTLGFKNMFGVLIHEDRHPYHRLPEHYYVLVDLMKLVRGRDLSVVDAVIAMDGYGPRFGDPVQMDLVIAGADPVATEAVAALVAGFSAAEGPIEVLPVAEREGLGTRDLARIEVRGRQIAEVRRDFKRPPMPWLNMDPRVKTYPGGTCWGCGLWMQYSPVPSELEDGRTYALVTGQEPVLPNTIDADEVWLLGNCAIESVNIGKLRKKGHKVVVLPGCNPYRLEPYLEIHKWEAPYSPVCRHACCRPGKIVKQPAAPGA